VNAAGGLAGHQVQLLVADDAGDPARNRALTQQMIERNHVVAFVHNMAPLSGQASVTYVEEKRIPVVGSEGGSSWVNENSMYFPQMSSDRFAAYSFAGAAATAARAEGKKKVALFYCAEVQGCATVTKADAYREFGMEVVHQGRISVAQPDFTAECLSARDAGAEVVWLGSDAQTPARFAESCARVGDYRPLFTWASQVTTDRQAKNPNLQGAAIGPPAAPWFVDGLPAVREFRDAMARFATGVSIDGSALQGWASAKLFERAARRLSQRPTSSDILDGLWSVAGDDLGGLTFPLRFDREAPNNATYEQSCWWIVRIRHEEFTSPDGGQRHCR
jgi:branched-chain amino acid transport system substrate-binding protein